MDLPYVLHYHGVDNSISNAISPLLNVLNIFCGKFAVLLGNPPIPEILHGGAPEVPLPVKAGHITFTVLVQLET